jgi:hypothetical protein
VSERRDFACGCAWIKVADSNWYQVVACPEHMMDMLPKTEPFVTARTKKRAENGP